MAGHFKGRVFVDGDLTVTGVKGAVVAHPDGSRRLFCAIESPESWFEDFGEATLESGRSEVTLDADFSHLTNTYHYHVFLTPYGDSKGLYVESRSPESFVVREQQDGKSTLRFSYRVVAKRGDVEVPRFKRVDQPQEIPDEAFRKDESYEGGVDQELPPDHEEAVMKPRTHDDVRLSRPRISMEKPNVSERMKRS